MFAGEAFSYFLSRIFLNYYDKWEVVVVQNKEKWMTFFPKRSEKITLEEGKDLYTSQKETKKYVNDFEGYKKDASILFESVLSKEKLNRDDLEVFFKKAAEHFSFYSKTEFFYTDAIPEGSMAITVKEFDELKLSGRTFLNKIIFENDGYVRRLLNKIKEETGEELEDLLYYSPEEILDLVENGDRQEKNIEDRKKAFIIGGELDLYGRDASGLVDSFLSNYLESGDEITGSVAYPGKVTAKARIFNPNYNDFDALKNEIELMQEGEVLVAETTAPEIIAACKKASAIITNQGGTLSHAAIVAREFKIPCIVGTQRDVVRNIKTGDLIEVNADNGVITIKKKI